MAAVQELVDCMISSWYPKFQRVTFKTVILPLPQPVLDWLVSDGLHLPDDSEAFAKRGTLDEYAMEDEYREWSSSEAQDDAAADSRSDDTASVAVPQPPPAELAQLRRQLDAAIAELGGRVVPKLSWSCPKDAVWMSPTSSLCCANADEVLLLLRSSDRVAHDICTALQDAAGAAGTAGAADAGGAEPAVQHCVALRRWHDLQPGREFRCFVRGQRLVGVCQRDVTQCYEFLRDERAQLLQDIQAFHDKHIGGRFPQPHFTFDVYVATSGAVRLLDFNPVAGTTAPLLFTWEELGLAEPAGTAGAAAGAAGAAAGTAGAAAGVADVQGGEGAAGATPGAAAGRESGCGACGTQQNQPTAEQGVSSSAAAAKEPSYLEQLRRVQALSLAEQQGQGDVPAPAGGADTGANTAAAAEPAQPAQEPEPGQQQLSTAAPAAPAVELRIIEEPVAMRPATMAYGVPFDFVDSSEGSALDRLMQQARQAGAAELWAALAEHGGGGGGAAGMS